MKYLVRNFGGLVWIGAMLLATTAKAAERWQPGNTAEQRAEFSTGKVIFDRLYNENPPADSVTSKVASQSDIKAYDYYMRHAFLAYSDRNWDASHPDQSAVWLENVWGFEQSLDKHPNTHRDYLKSEIEPFGRVDDLKAVQKLRASNEKARNAQNAAVESQARWATCGAWVAGTLGLLLFVGTLVLVWRSRLQFKTKGIATLTILLLAAFVTLLQMIQSKNEEVSKTAMGLLIVLIALCLIPLYITPVCIAVFKKHHQLAAIAAVNLLLGWTFLGWVISLIWALTKPTEVHLSVTPTPPPIPSGFDAPDIQLRKVSDLHRDGLISDAEFELKRSELLRRIG